MLAVLPFANLTGDPGKEYLADGLTEEMISQLGRLNPGQVGVIARVYGGSHEPRRLLRWTERRVRLDRDGSRN